MKTSLSHVRSQGLSCRQTFVRLTAPITLAFCLAPAAIAHAHDSAATKDGLSKVFTKIWSEDGWHGGDSKSGPGSDLQQTRVVREKLTALIKDYDVKSVVDLACGDFFWMKHVDFAGASYIGVDIVEPMIELLQRTYQTEDGMRSFLAADAVTDPLPKADLVIARDVLGHLTYEHGQALIDNVRASGATYFLSTYFTGNRVNSQIVDGEWRPLDLSKAPYNLGAPIAVIHEDCLEANGAYADKELGLWRIAP